jgi:septal ring factor EnvC (AmiA/AmiB activator)
MEIKYYLCSSNHIKEEQMSKNNISEELVQACENLVKELDRVELAKKKKREEEEKAEAEKLARREYWKKKLYSGESSAMTFIVPDDSKLK